MSRVGKLPIPLPPGVEIEIKGDLLRVKGPLGALERKIHSGLQVEKGEGKLYIRRTSESKFYRSLHGLTRTLVANMVEGVSQGFEKVLQIIGVGYKADLVGHKLNFQLGYCHPILFEPPEGINLEVQLMARAGREDVVETITVKGIDKELVGQVAAKLRSFQPPDPYKGKGIRYKGEKVRRKAGKTAA